VRLHKFNHPKQLNKTICSIKPLTPLGPWGFSRDVKQPLTSWIFFAYRFNISDSPLLLSIVLVLLVEIRRFLRTFLGHWKVPLFD
jgi:hypothetical protein